MLPEYLGLQVGATTPGLEHVFLEVRDLMLFTAISLAAKSVPNTYCSGQ
jgi:hypothetical protein